MAVSGATGAITMTAGESLAEAAEVGPMTTSARRLAAYKLRLKTAAIAYGKPLPTHVTNGDEEKLPQFIAAFAKGLPHNSLGEPDIAAYDTLVKALASGTHSALEAVPLGGTTKLASMQTAYAFDLEGTDTHMLAIPAAPAFASAQQAAEMGEVYWRALTRDVPFSQYASHPLVGNAIDDLNLFSDIRAPKVAGAIDADTIFRGSAPGAQNGPFISQFLYQPIPFGAMTIEQKYTTAAANIDFMTSPAEWLSIQRGFAPTAALTFDPTPRFIRNARDLGEYVHRDFTYQAYLTAALILNSYGAAALDAANPYLSSAKQRNGVTFGAPMILELLARVTMPALTGAFFQKWLLHRRLRPEEFAGRVHHHMNGAATYPIHDDILNSDVLGELMSVYGTMLLPAAYPEGCPTHPSYPAAHATQAGACVTVLKAFFNESFVIPNPVVASDDGLSLVPYTGPALTVGGELNKLATNIAHGRDGGGVHYRSDGVAGMLLGEAIALSILSERGEGNHTEPFSGFSLTKFNGTTVTIG
ncbi:hypothetical protein SCE1572_09075 [Sorangium cellulosum So0157-2]|uniref:Phosphoesterase n=2 Tax=Sorangium cellulosum TaxID=56 RepID=S4XN83_SORCE|nr:hypothetical protein SCE1572_09075 [Sorangium cellulosum So0157-2]